MADQMVRCKNVGDKPFKDGYANVTYVLPPGKDVFVPYDAAVLWFGNPDVFDVSARQRGRTDFYHRLRLRYGAFDDHRILADGSEVRFTADELWEENKPQVEVYTLEGERLHTIIDDPEGTNVDPAQTNPGEAQGILARMGQLEAELGLLRQAQAAQTATADEVDDDGFNAGEDDGDGDDAGASGGGKDDAAGKTPTPPSTTPAKPTTTTKKGDAEPDRPPRPGVKS